MWPGRWRGEGLVIAGCPSSPALGEAEIAPSAGDCTGTSRRCSQRARSWDDAVASRPPPPRGPAGEPPTTRRGRSGSGWDCATTMVRPGSPGRKRQPVSEWLRSRERAVATGTSAKRLVQRRLCGVRASVASSQMMPRIPSFLDRERHITISSQPRTALALPGHGSLAMPTGTRNPREIAGLMDSLRVLRSGNLCGVRPVSRSKEQAVVQVDVT